MQAYEFYATSVNGVINIPNEYRNKIGNKFKVIIIDDTSSIKKKQNKPKITWEEIEELCGIIRSDIDEKAELEESRRERFEIVD